MKNMDTIKIEKPLVDINWLAAHLENDNLVVLNANLPKAVAGGVPREEGMRIPGARFFDIKNIFSDVNATYPNTWPGQKAFNVAAQLLGINKNSSIVVYDEHGIYSSARAWWMFRAMGHENIAVLNGGLVSWKKAGYPLESKNDQIIDKGDFHGTFNTKFFKNHEAVLRIINDPSEFIVDARAADRFKGLQDEPRKGLRSGHIPSSLNLPYSDLLIEGELLADTELKNIFSGIAPIDQNLTFSCGSGITACVLALAAETVGYSNLSVYDGSWTEWGSLEQLPIEKAE